jgi:hypothetical protein
MRPSRQEHRVLPSPLQLRQLMGRPVLGDRTLPEPAQVRQLRSANPPQSGQRTLFSPTQLGHVHTRRVFLGSSSTLSSHGSNPSLEGNASRVRDRLDVEAIFTTILRERPSHRINNSSTGCSRTPVTDASNRQAGSRRPIHAAAVVRAVCDCFIGGPRSSSHRTSRYVASNRRKCPGKTRRTRASSSRRHRHARFRV